MKIIFVSKENANSKLKNDFQIIKIGKVIKFL